MDTIICIDFDIRLKLFVTNRHSKRTRSTK